METFEQTISEITLYSRKKLQVNGIEDIVSFDETQLTVQTVLGRLAVEGEGLRIGELSHDKAMLSVEGKIDALYYLDETERKKRSFFGK